MRRLLLAVAACAAVLAAPASAAAASWARAQIAAVTEAGVFTATPQTFRPDAPLTAGTLARVVATLDRQPAAPPADPAAGVSIAELDAALVRAAGLGDAAHRFYLGARAAGLAPPGRFGTETVARLLGLRVDHPPAQESLELQPQETATRAEAAYSVAALLRLDAGAAQAMEEASHAFVPPALTPAQREVLHTALSLIGYPYVWAGTDERTDRGFDCSGFVWRVFKVATYPDLPGLADAIVGRTTMEMSAQVPRGERIPLERLAPGDVLFFGHGPSSKPSAIDHAGIYLGDGWFVHSSGEGVALAPLSGGYRDGFAWADRPLARAQQDPPNE
ncbi:MAG TPA: C40 family peptidase [Gaiellaceae bacterium]|jgi:cell wall-associated NlpC family hydrolase